MKKKSITSILIITMFGASFIVASDLEMYSWHFSDMLDDGDRLEWKVKFLENDTAVTTLDPSPDSPPFINESKVELFIHSKVHSINVNSLYTEEELNAAFELKIDGSPQPLMVDGEISMWLLILLNPIDLLTPATGGVYNY
ncbi:MAG: hypothetical protein ACXAD7_26170, partial [Candidatus Kariarchaeaceae archaeon]